MPREDRSSIRPWRPLTLGNPHPLVEGVAVVEVDPQAIAAENIALDEAKGDLLDQVHAIAAGAPTGGKLGQRYMTHLPAGIFEKVPGLSANRFLEPHVYQAREAHARVEGVRQQVTYSNSPRHKDGSWTGTYRVDIAGDHDGFSQYGPRVELDLKRSNPSHLRINWNASSRDIANNILTIPGLEHAQLLQSIIMQVQMSVFAPASGYFSINIDLDGAQKDGILPRAIRISQTDAGYQRRGLSSRQEIVVKYDESEGGYVIPFKAGNLGQKDAPKHRVLRPSELVALSSEALGLVPFVPSDAHPSAELMSRFGKPAESATDIQLDIWNTLEAAQQNLNFVAAHMDYAPEDNFIVNPINGWSVENGGAMRGETFAFHGKLEADYNFGELTGITDEIVGVVQELRLPDYPYNVRNLGWEDVLLGAWEQALSTQGIRNFMVSQVTEANRAIFERMGYTVDHASNQNLVAYKRLNSIES